MVGVHCATDNDDDGRVRTAIPADPVGGGNKFVSDAPVTSLEPPSRRPPLIHGPTVHTPFI